jgi:ATP sulfurylase
MIGDKKVICTVGISPLNRENLLRMQGRGADFFRINLSHTKKEEIESKIIELKEYSVPTMIDTEGSQIRTGNLEEIHFFEGSVVKIYDKQVPCNSNSLFFTPFSIVEKFVEGDLLNLDFNSVLIKVTDTSTLSEGYLSAVVLIGGNVGGRKGVHLEGDVKLPAFSEKDLHAIELAKKHGITNFTLSFIDDDGEVNYFRSLMPGAFFLTKVETAEAVKNLDKILDVSPGILIDRGDLSRYVYPHKMPFVQKAIIKAAKKKGKVVVVASGTLENMSFSLQPTKAEVNDIVKIIDDGADGIVLTKESAVGLYPVETLNMLNNIIIEYNLMEKVDALSIPELSSSSLAKPHGGVLTNSIIKKTIPDEQLMSMKKIRVDEETIMDMEQIAIGAFSPLKGFMTSKELFSVLDTLRLPSGVVWPLPILFQLKKEELNGAVVGDKILLTSGPTNEPHGWIVVSEIYQLDKEEIVKKWFETNSSEHPGVVKIMNGGNYFVAGEVKLLKRRASKIKMHELTPRQTRKFFLERGWTKVVGFHTRNVIHKSHEFIQLSALDKSLADGLFLHPVIGKKKKGDFESDVIIESYEKMINSFYPKGKALLSAFSTYSRYSGPREALFTALVRKNFGCSHFIVGRDHTGVKDFYAPHASHDIFDQFTEGELGIIPIKFDKVFFSPNQDKHVHLSDSQEHPSEDMLNISGTQAREMFLKGERPPEWFMRPEISDSILNKLKKGSKVFV